MNVSSSRTQLRSQLRESVRTAILDAAEDLIANKGLQNAPLLQIAKKAGVAVGTLYNYFEDRDALIRALFDLRRASLRPQLRAAVTSTAELPFETRLHAFVRNVLAAFETHRKFVKVAIEAEHLKLSSQSTTAQDLLAAIDEIISAGTKERVLAADRHGLLPLLLVGAIRALVLRRIAENAKLDAADAAALVAFFLDGARR
jgi:AcrR family transcriptional regulator